MMKNNFSKGFLSACFALILCLLASGTIAAQPTLDLKEKEHAFGTIHAGGGIATREFHFKNNGNMPLVIMKAETNCSCTKIVFPKRPVNPGAEGVITVTYDPKHQSGTFYKAINIYSNIPEKRTILIVSGTVNAAVK